MPAQDQQAETGVVPRQRVFVVAGGAAGDFTITGIAVGDYLSSVVGFLLTEAGPNGITILNLTSEFSITAANTINNGGGTSSAAGMLFVTYYDNPNA